MARRRLLVVGCLLALACNSDTTQPAGPPALVEKTGGDAQSWYHNNPLPTAFSVTVVDANSTPVPGVQVDWAIVTGTGGSLSRAADSTDSKGIAQTVLTLGSGTVYVVTASVAGLPSVTFSANGAAPPVRDSVAVKDDFFQPDSVVLQVNDTVYWTWAGSQNHNVTFGPGQASATQSSGTYNRQFTAVGKFAYTCTLHSGMKGVVVVVN
ncbi:MAG TPA: plastocyanin/azurin family copper-binding protein [Gemmatimonadales bacterium]|nr:plastocyanin/azurin family copper-binding protein [Gemmatimonadales bacterium]